MKAEGQRAARARTDFPRPRGHAARAVDRTSSSRATTTSSASGRQKRQAAPATGEATASGPATVDVKDGGAGVRFNFPGTGAYRPIEWDEWFENFDRHDCAFVFDNDGSTQMSSRYRIVKASEWKDFLC